jgi:chondroitin 4-sulfotransferase 11
MIDHNLKCIFIHIPRTAGHSISAILDYNIKNIPQSERLSRHAFSFEYENRFPEEFKDYFKFTFIRNPFDRLVSAWIRCYKLYSNKSYIAKSHNDVEFFNSKIKPEFTSFIKNHLHLYVGKSHFRQQYQWLRNCHYDFIGRYEHLSTDIQLLCSHLNITGYDIKHLSATKRTDFSRYYTEESKHIVTSLYKKDIDIWTRYNKK